MNSREPEPVTPEELIAYLDGELETNAHSELEQRLENEPELQQRLEDYRQSWELLDELPRATVDHAFARSTLVVVAVSAAHDNRRNETARRQRSILSSVLFGLTVVSASVAGYFTVDWILQAEDRQIARDLPLIENLDAYRHAESVEFLEALAEQDWFAVEEEDAL